MTLTEFLEARIAEDEEIAQSATPGPWEQNNGRSVFGPRPEDAWYGPNLVADTKQRDDAEFIARFNPARVLAECKAKRRIVALHEKCGTGRGRCDDGGHGWDDELGCLDLALLALPDADHPDYRPEWKP